MKTLFRCVIAALAAACLMAPAAAQVQRQFPEKALRGEMVFVDPPQVRLNGKAAMLAPGSRIRGQNNMLQMSGELLGAKLWVHYTMDTQGALMDVWILRPEELAKKPWPATAAEAQAWVFDPTAQAWIKP
jgi:choline dehydrogenase-like flavoprotein